MHQLFQMWPVLHNQDVWLSCFLIRCQKYILQPKSPITESPPQKKKVTCAASYILVKMLFFKRCLDWNLIGWRAQKNTSHWLEICFWFHWRIKILEWQNEITELHMWGHRVTLYFLSGDLNVSIQRHVGPIRVLPVLGSYPIIPNILGTSSTVLWISSVVTLRHRAWFWGIAKRGSEPGLVHQIDYRMENHHFLLTKGGWL